jgi:hypothetical protein
MSKLQQSVGLKAPTLQKMTECIKNTGQMISKKSTNTLWRSPRRSRKHSRPKAKTRKGERLSTKTTAAAKAIRKTFMPMTATNKHLLSTRISATATPKAQRLSSTWTPSRRPTTTIWRKSRSCLLTPKRKQEKSSTRSTSTTRSTASQRKRWRAPMIISANSSTSVP